MKAHFHPFQMHKSPNQIQLQPAAEQQYKGELKSFSRAEHWQWYKAWNEGLNFPLLPKAFHQHFLISGPVLDFDQLV